MVDIKYILLEVNEMDIDKKIDILVCSDNKQAYDVLKELLEKVNNAMIYILILIHLLK